MTPSIKEAYNKAFNVVSKKTILRKSEIPKELSYRETLWNNLTPAIYVMSAEGEVEYFKKEASKQGFERLLHILEIEPLTPHCPPILKEYFSNIPVTGAGCHMSHALIAKDVIDSGYSHALIFENDCAFREIISDNFLKELTEWYLINKEFIEFLNLGHKVITSYSVPTSLTYKGKLFSVSKGPSHLTHSYLLNNLGAQKIKNTTDVTIPCPEGLYVQDYNSERYFRGGGDDYFAGFTEQYSLDHSITFQQFIGNNKYLSDI